MKLELLRLQTFIDAMKIQNITWSNKDFYDFWNMLEELKNKKTIFTPGKMKDLIKSRRIRPFRIIFKKFEFFGFFLIVKKKIQKSLRFWIKTVWIWIHNQRKKILLWTYSKKIRKLQNFILTI